MGGRVGLVPIFIASVDTQATKSEQTSPAIIILIPIQYLPLVTLLRIPNCISG